MKFWDSVQKGSIQAGQSASYYYIGKNPALAFDCCVPFGLTARQQAGWLHHGGGLELTRRTFADFNILNFPLATPVLKWVAGSREKSMDLLTCKV